MKNAVIILAAGKGERLGLECPKQYLPICGKPVLEYSLALFQNTPEISEIILVVDKTWDENKNRISLDQYTKIKATVPGGARRQDSVHNGLKEVSSDTNVVLIHDSARAFAPEKGIKDGNQRSFKKRCGHSGRTRERYNQNHGTGTNHRNT